MRSQHVKRVVDVSALGRDTAHASRAGHVTASLAMDDLIASTGVAFRALTMPSFMDNLLRQVRAIKEQGTIFDVISPDRKLPIVATRDIAAIAARLLLDDSWTGQQAIPLLGPRTCAATTWPPSSPRYSQPRCASGRSPSKPSPTSSPATACRRP